MIGFFIDMKITNLAENNTILNHFVSELRDVDIHNDSMRFRNNIERIGQILAYEVSKSLQYTNADVVTPLGVAKTCHVEDNIVVASILRAGLPLHNGILSFFDKAENCFVSAYRKYINEKEFDVHVEYIASPSLDGKTVILADPMLATGSSMELAYKALLTHGTPKKVIICSVIASQYAIDYVSKHLPSDICEVYTAVIDPDLNEHAYIVPGLGDAGDLAFGEKLSR